MQYYSTTAAQTVQTNAERRAIPKPPTFLASAIAYHSTSSILEGDMPVNSSKANYPQTPGASALSLSHALGGQLYYKSLLGRLPICCIINSLPRPPTTGISRKTEDEKLTKRHARFALSKHTYRSMFWSTATVRLRFGVVALNITPCTHSAARKHDVVYTRYPHPKGDASIYCCC